MAKQASKALIGAFVVGAIALLVAAVLVLGGGKFFKETLKVVMFFQGSVKGLTVGSPVMFRGVKIGSVTDIKLVINARDLSARTPVFAELEPERWTVIGGERDPTKIGTLIDRGLRAQLQTLSFVTGQLMIAFDFFPDKPARFVGLIKEYPEIPTVPTSIQELSKTLQELPWKEIVTNLNNTLDGIQRIVNSPDVKESTRAMHLTLREARELIEDIDTRIGPLLANLDTLTNDTRQSLKTAENAMSVMQHEAPLVATATKQTLETARSALEQAEKTLTTFSDDSNLVYEMNKALRELSSAIRSIRLLSDYLERHPETLLRGKPRQE